MNYGKKKASDQQKKITSKSTMKKKRVGVRLFKGFLLCILLVAVLCVAGVGIFAKKIIDNSPDISPEDVQPSKYTTFVYAADGTTETARFVSAGANRVNKSIEDIPKDLQHAFVAIEDERFYKHNGVDLQGVLRAGFVGLTTGNFSEGASTLTQQLIKNNVFPNFTEEKTFYDRLERKLQEQYLAIEIEKQMSKDEIMESYLNTINLGQNSLGVQTAAKRYFGKDVSELTLSEDAVIAAITQSPSKYNPITNPDDNARRRKKVLKAMLDQKYITQAQYDEAMADPVYDRIQSVNSSIDNERPNTYFVDELSKEVLSDLQRLKGYTETQAYNALYSGGLKIYSTQDLYMQQIADEEVNNPDNYPSRIRYTLSYLLTITRSDGTVENYDENSIKSYMINAYGIDSLTFDSQEEGQAMVDEFKSTLAREGDIYDEKVTLAPQPQASVVVMDQYTGQIKAIVGGRGPKSESQSLNRATSSPRQPGSCFKVLSTYAPALDSAGKTLATVIKDEPFSYDDGTPVRNWWGDSYKGNVTMRKAIEQSMNICAVKMLTEITPQLGYDYLTNNFGFTTLVNGAEINGQIFYDAQQPLALGGITKGVYNQEMTAAYAALANNGVYNTPVYYTKILDHDGNVLIENPGESHVAVKDTTAALLTNAMMDVMTQGTGTKAQLSNMPVSGKTGTTSDDVDIWLSAYTPYYTCSVWSGYDDNTRLSNTSFHLYLWRNIMERIHENLEYKDFTMPDTIEQKWICTQTGKLAISGVCPSYQEYFAPGTAPTEVCSGNHWGGSSKSYSDDEDDSSDSENSTENTGETTTPPEGGTETPPEEQPPAEDGGVSVAPPEETPPEGGEEAPEAPAEGGEEAPPAE